MSAAMAGTTIVVLFPLDWFRQSFADAERAALLANETLISATMEAALRVRFIRDTFFVDPKTKKRPLRFSESGYDSFKDWCESHDRTEQWGQYLCNAADHAQRVENPGQARELAGLGDEEADAVVAEAEGAGPVTAATLAAARERIVNSNRTAATRIEDEMRLRKIVGKLQKCLSEARQLDGTPSDKWFNRLEKCLEWCQEQLATEKMAA